MNPPTDEFSGSQYRSPENATPVIPPAIDLQPRRRKWPIIVTLLAVALLLSMYGCYRTVRTGKVEANNLVAKLHQQMRGQDFSGIYSQSSTGYKNAESRDNSDALFAGIYRKLGTPLESRQLNMTISATNHGKTIVAIFSTRFSNNADARETISWRKEGGTYRLLGYTITSSALLTR